MQGKPKAASDVLTPTLACACLPSCCSPSSFPLQTVVRPQLRESAAHQAVIPQRIGAPPASIELPLRWEAGPSFEEAMESAQGPEKAAADLLPLDATFDPETHEGAGELATLCYHLLCAAAAPLTCRAKLHCGGVCCVVLLILQC